MTAPLLSNPAETYERYYVPAMFRPWAGLLLREAAPAPGERLLDVACGTGIVAREAAAALGASGQVVGVDLNPAMLAVARALPPAAGAPIEWREGNAMALPSPDAAFDLVTCQHGLPFFPDGAQAVAEMRRVLSTGGRAAVIVLQALARHPVFEALMQAVSRGLGIAVGAVATPFALSDADALRALFDTAGFGPVSLKAVSATMRFPEADRFVPLAVSSSAAAVPAFALLDAPGRQALVQAVQGEMADVLAGHREGGSIVFPMHAWVVVARA